MRSRGAALIAAWKRAAVRTIVKRIALDVWQADLLAFARVCCAAWLRHARYRHTMVAPATAPRPQRRLDAG